MRLSKPVGLLVFVGVLAFAVGGIATLALGGIVVGDPTLPFARVAALATLALVVVLVVVATVRGAGSREWRENPYW